MTFTLWSGLHYFMILSPFALTVLLYLTLKDKTDKTKQIVGIVLSSIACALLLARNIEIFINNNYQFHYEIVPIQNCHFANFVLLYAFIKRSDAAFGFAFLYNMILAYLSLVFADGLENYTNILTARGQAYIWGHILLVLIPLYAYVIGFIKLNYKQFFRIIGVTAGLYVISLFINNFFNIVLNQPANYFYTAHPEAGTPLDFFYNLGVVRYIGAFEFNLMYMISLMLFGSLVISMFYVLTFELPRYVSKSKQLQQ